MIGHTEPESKIEPKVDAEAAPGDLDERLGEAIEAYLELVEAGNPPDPEAFAAGYPDFAEDLLASLEGLALVKGLVGEGSGPGHRLEEGRRVAGYRIVRELGRGGMGIVYEAVHVGLDRPVALKVLGTQAAPDSSGRRRFLNEAKTAAGLHHTHIVPVFDVGQVGGLCYYAMQRIEGSGLDRVLRMLRRDRSVAAGSTHGSASRKKGSTTKPAAGTGNMARPLLLPPSKPEPDAALAVSGLGDLSGSWGAEMGSVSLRRREAVDDPPPFVPPRGSAYHRWVADVGRQAAEALAYAHQRGVIHRDIKPSNLLIDATGTVWVADFGLARRLADPSQTQFDSLLGTPRYMSPEQAKTGAIDGRADLYSLGATLYELVTLRPPFDGQSAAELIEQITDREVPRPGRFDARIPLDLETILLKALAKRPADRYETAEAMADDLARFLAHEPVKARRIGPVGRLVRFARRHPSLTAVSTAAAAIVLTTATVAYVQVLASARDARDAQARTEDFNGQLKDSIRKLNDANRKLNGEMLDRLEKQAASVVHSTDANRRANGLDALRQAAAMGPDAATRVRLRDQALTFLSMRDVQAASPIATVEKSHHGLAFGPDGSRIAALFDDGELGIWEVEAGRPIDATRRAVGLVRNRAQAGRGGRGGPSALGGPRIATAGGRVLVIQPDGAGVRSFDLAGPDAPPGEWPMRAHPTTGLWASADGRTLLTLARPSSFGQGQGRPNGEGRPGPDRPDGRFDFLPPEEIRFHLWDRDHPGAPKATLTLPASKLEGSPRGIPWPLLAIAPDGSKVAAARRGESEVSLWDGDGRPLKSVEAPWGSSALALGPAGVLAVAVGGGEVALWDLSTSTPKPLPGLGLRQSWVDLLRFGPGDGSTLAAAASRGGGIELWDLTTRSLIAALPTAEIEDLAFSPDGRTLAAGQPSSIATWALARPVGQDVLPESGDLPTAVAFGPGDVLAIASREPGPNPGPAELRLWDRPGQSPPSIRTWDHVRPGSAPSSVGFDAGGRLFALESDAIRWFDPRDPDPVEVVDLPRPDDRRSGRPDRPDRKGQEPAPGRPVASWVAARSPDGRTLIVARSSASMTPVLSLWRADEPGAPARLDLPEAGTPGRGVLDPSGTRFYALLGPGRRGEEARLVAREIRGTSAQRVLWSTPVAQPTALAIAPDGSTLAVGLRSGAVELVAPASGEVRGRATPPADEAVPVESLAFDPDGRTLAVGLRERVRLWDLAGPPRPVVRLPGHRGAVRSLAFDARGGRLAATDEKTVKVWDLGLLRAELARLGLDW